MFDEFDASVLDIVGLTDYRPLKLPEWLRVRLDEMFGALEDHPSDGELAGAYIDDGRSWLGGWGTAAINREQVLICESVGCDCECFNAVFIAELNHCGLVFVEPSGRFDVGTTVYFTQARSCAKRDFSSRKVKVTRGVGEVIVPSATRTAFQ